MRTTLNNLVMILTVAGLSLAGSAALAKGGSNGGSHSSSNSVSRNFTSKSVQSLNLSNSNKQGPTQTFKKIQSGNLVSQLNGSASSSSPKTKILQGNNAIKKLPKPIDAGMGNGNKVVDSGMKKSQGNKQIFCKDFGKNKCHDKFCWPWWNTSCHSNCYDPCYDSCYDTCYYGCFTPYYTTTVVEVPVVIEKQVIVEQPVLTQGAQPLAAVQQPNAVPQIAGTAEAPKEELMQVPVGATITLRGEAFGEKSGRVAMQVGELLLGSKVTKWENQAVTITLPQVGLAAAAKGKFLILKADGALATEVPFELVPPQSPAVGQQ